MSKIVKSKAAVKIPKKTKAVKVTDSNLFSTHSDRPRFTGKRIVMMNNETKASFMKSFAKKNNFKIASIKDFSTDTGNYHDAFSQGDGIYFDK
jgi:hypothetical protein